MGRQYRKITSSLKNVRSARVLSLRGATEVQGATKGGIGRGREKEAG